MSTFRIGSRPFPSLGTTFTSAQKRYLHRASDYNYMKIWKKAQIDFIQQLTPIHKNPEWNPGDCFFKSPKLIEQILRTILALKKKGLVPFLHGMPAGSRVHLKLMEAIYPHSGKDYFSYLRPPTKNYAIPHEKALQHIPTQEVQSAKNHLISMSYALTSGTRHLETAASWGFVNHFGKAQFFELNSQCRAALKTRVLTQQESAYFESSIFNLIIRYNRLKIGRFMAIGIPPEKLERFAYDSAPYNVPTGLNVLEVAREPEKYTDSLMEHGTHFATLVISEETLDSSSGIVIVDATHSQEANTFCGNDSFVPLKEIDCYAGLVSEVDTEFEEQQETERRQLDAALDLLMYQFQHREECADQFATLPECCSRTGDYPETMI